MLASFGQLHSSDAATIVFGAVLVVISLRVLWRLVGEVVYHRRQMGLIRELKMIGQQIDRLSKVIGQQRGVAATRALMSVIVKLSDEHEGLYRYIMDEPTKAERLYWATDEEISRELRRRKFRRTLGMQS